MSNRAYLAFLLYFDAAVFAVAVILLEPGRTGLDLYGTAALITAAANGVLVIVNLLRLVWWKRP